MALPYTSQKHDLLFYLLCYYDAYSNLIRKSKCTPRNFATTTLVSIPFILILQLSTYFLLLNIIKLVLDIFKESLFA